MQKAFYNPVYSTTRYVFVFVRVCVFLAQIMNAGLSQR